MSTPLLCKIGNTELLQLYGYEPYAGITIEQRWRFLTQHWTVHDAEELGHLRQIMLQIHKDCDPDDERWND